MLYAGIDAGSRAIKAILLDGGTRAIAASGVLDQGVEQEQLSRRLFEQLLEQAGQPREAVGRIVATGYGRNLVLFADTTITEITCHANGIRHVAPEAMTIIEIGGQDSKLIRMDAKGAVRDFAMNDRCAAGTGRFLEIVAGRLDLSLSELGEVAARSRKPAAISSMCAVFAETEIVGLLASGVPPEDIIAGVQLSIAKRVVAMAGRSVEEPVVFTGGVALVPGMADALRQALQKPVSIAPHPQFTGALGAAILAAKADPGLSASG
jgi:predicted CoA-substrate-specific enzyme activase